MTEETKRVLDAYKKLMDLTDAVDEALFDIDHEHDEYLPQHSKHILQLAYELVAVFEQNKPIEVETVKDEG